MEKKPWRDYIPDPPMMDFAYLQEKFQIAGKVRKLPHRGDGKPRLKTFIVGHGEHKIQAFTRTEARRNMCAMAGIKVLPQFTPIIEEVPA